MAKGQQGIGATTVWMIVFCFFWLVSTVWLVILYTGQEELRASTAQAQRDFRRVANPEELRSIEQVKTASETGPTALGLLEEARASTAEVATGVPADGVAVVRTKRNDFLKTIRADGLIENPEAFDEASLMSALNLLYDRFKQERAQRVLAEERLEQLDTEVAKLADLNSQLKDDFNKRTQELQDRMNSIESERAAYRTEQDNAVAVISKDFEQRRVQTDADLTELRQKDRQTSVLLKEMNARLKAQNEKYAELEIGPGKLSTARQPDGRILTAVPGDEIVYIDRGSSDRLVLGLKFGVYSARDGIPEDGVAKAQVEVVAINEKSSECRVLRLSPGQAILENDWIANPIYDPARSPSFVVLGYFDMNRDGLPDVDGGDSVEALIQNWGGTIAREVTALTDFVVLGAAPMVPRTPNNPTAEQTARIEALKRVHDHYHSILTSAQTLAVPIMTQDVFLNFLGQPERLARR